MSTTDPVIQGTCNLNFGDNTIKVLTANPTPGPDEYTDNDSLEITVDAVTNLDIGIVSVVEPLDPFSYGLNDIRILFKNYSNDSTITSADIDFKIDDVAQTTYNWTGTLLPGEISDTVTIKGAHDFTEASHSIKVWTLNPNSNDDDDNTISNCRLEGGNTGISLDGDAGTGYQLGVQISNNDFLDQKSKGIYCMEFKDIVTSSNSISSDSAITGIEINTQNAPGYHSIVKNLISINNQGTGISYAMEGSSGPISDTCLIVNNFIHTKNFGLYFVYNYVLKAKIYNNNINITGTNSGSSAFYSGNSSAYFDLKNNILCNKGNGYAYDEYGNTVERDYNNYFTFGQYISHWGAYETLEEWQAATSLDEHSISVIPAFVSDSNLHASNPALNEAGTPLVEVTDDIDGEARHATTPDIGADEFVPCSSPLSGDYTIGDVSPDFETFSDAINRLTGCGINGPATFTIASGTYIEQLYIPEISGASETNTVTFQSASGDSSDVILTHTPLNETHSYTVLMDGTDYITFKNITLKTGANWGRTVKLKNEATNNQFLNNKFSFEGTPLNDDDSFIYSSGSLDSNNVFNSNLFENGSVGIYMNGSTASDSIAGIQIKNNIFTDMVSGGVYLKKHKNLNISGNQFEVLNSTYSYGIY